MTDLNRYEHEVLHGERLASSGVPEAVWNWDTPAGRVRARRRFERMAAAAGLVQGMRILEVGCGTGLFTEMFASRVAEVVGLDIAPALLALAAKRNLPAKSVRFMEGRYENLSSEGPFDAIVGSSVLHHLDVPVALWKTWHLLKPGCRMAFAEPNMMNPQIALQKHIPWLKARLGDSPDETAFVRWSLERQVAAVGFLDVQIDPFDWLHPSTPACAMAVVSHVGAAFERLPIVREFAGSLLISGRRAS